MLSPSERPFLLFILLLRGVPDAPVLRLEGEAEGDFLDGDKSAKVADSDIVGLLSGELNRLLIFLSGAMSNKSERVIVLLIKERKERRVPTLCLALVHPTEIASTLGGVTTLTLISAML